MRDKEIMVPLSAIEKLIEIHYKHLNDITLKFEQHLTHIAVLYERALNPPPIMSEIEGKLWSSEDEEDEQYLIMQAEQRALKELQNEGLFNEGDIVIS